uniref:MATH domain-containing protein n=1 Tax=Panagrolaimus superbus TaxID=310955 RepID=A0A914Z5V8_9BILA
MKFQSKVRSSRPKHSKMQVCNLKFSFNKEFLESHTYGSLKTSIFMIDGVRWWLTIYYNYNDELCFSLSCHCNTYVSAHLNITLLPSPVRKAMTSFTFKRGFAESQISPLISRGNLFKYYFKNGNKYINLKFDGYIVSFG